MHVRKLGADCWDGAFDNGDEIEGPSIHDLMSAIERLDAQRHTIVTLHQTGEAHMAVGGGAGQYIVYATSDNQSFATLLRPNAPREQLVELFIGGQKGEYPAHEVVSKALAVQAARTYFETGELDSGLVWRNE